MASMLDNRKVKDGSTTVNLDDKDLNSTTSTKDLNSTTGNKTIEVDPNINKNPVVEEGKDAYTGRGAEAKKKYDEQIKQEALDKKGTLDKTTEDTTESTTKVDKLELDEDTSVESRIDSILDKNSDLMKRTEQLGLAQANASGALSSTASARAAQSALLDRAESIATKDSEIAARFKELGFQHDSTIAQMNEAQKLKFEEMDKEFGFSQHVMDRTEAFQKWSLEKGWDADKTENVMKMYTSVGNQLMSAMAAMAGNQQVTSKEQQDVMNSAKDIFDSIFTIGGLDLEVS